MRLTATFLVLAALLTDLGLASLPSPARAERPNVPHSGSGTAAQMARWVLASNDNGGLPFIVIDKVAADVQVFDADGDLRGATPALLGLARGDDSVPGIGDRQLEMIRPEERTTPAGRFLASFGPAFGKDDAFWVDYATAISLHPTPTTNPKEHRLRRLLTPSPKDNRITYGCINVPRAFYEGVIRPTFKGTRGVVYILPEAKPLDEVFPTFATQAALSSTTTGAGATTSSPP